MKKIMVLAGPLLSYLVCWLVYELQMGVFQQADNSVTGYFLAECIGFLVIGILVVMTSEAIREERRETITKIFCAVDIIAPVVIWFLGISSTYFMITTNTYLFIYFIILGAIIYSLVRKK